MTSGSTTWNYKYNADGLRTERSNGSTTYEYVYSGSSLVHMSVGSNLLYFTYDGSVPMTVTYNGDVYYYVTNLQGDVVAILDGSGNAVVQYTYDAWGSILSTTGTLADTLGQHNPLRYRGYVYDTETELYYLQSRYYDPEIGRFINADSQFDQNAGLHGYNLFAYCANNPVIHKDVAGASITLACVVVGSVIGFIIGSVVGGYYAESHKGLSPSDGWDYWKNVVYGGIGGGALGGLAGWAFAGTNVAASISWAYYKATTSIGVSSYAI